MCARVCVYNGIEFLKLKDDTIKIVLKKIEVWMLKRYINILNAFSNPRMKTPTVITISTEYNII